MGDKPRPLVIASKAWQSHLVVAGFIPASLSGGGQAPTLQAREILSTKCEMLNNTKSQNFNDQDIRVLNLEHHSLEFV